MFILGDCEVVIYSNLYSCEKAPSESLILLLFRLLHVAAKTSQKHRLYVNFNNPRMIENSR